MLFLVLIVCAFGELACKERCCQDICHTLCDDEKADFGCSKLMNELGSSPGYLCMKEFLVMETELRLLYYYFQYYSYSVVFGQLKVVLKQIPLFHAECYLYINGIQY